MLSYWISLYEKKTNDNPRTEPREEGYSIFGFHSMLNINYIKEFQLITSAGPDVSTIITPKCYMLSPLRKINHHIWSQLPVLSTDRLHPPNPTNATSVVHWEKLITTSDHSYQFCPLTDYIHLIWPMLPMLSTERS
jgi:hypothetical protein